MAARTASMALGGDVIIYGTGNVVVAALNFGLFAVYARHLRPEDYGAMSLIVTVCAGVSMLGMMGINNAVQRFFFDENNEAAKRRVWSSGFVGGLALTLAFAAVAALVFQYLGRSIPALAGPAALIALVTVIPQTAIVWMQDRARLQFNAWSYVRLALLQVVIAGGAGIYFVAARGDGLRGFFLGSATGAFVTITIALLFAKQLWPLVFSSTEFRRLIGFGAPFVPAGVAIWASTTVLRWELVHFKSLAAAGFFDVAWKLAAPVWMLNTAVGQAFGPFAFRLRAEDPAYREKLVDWFHLLGGATLLVSCALALFAQELCAVIAPATYADAALPCAILAFAFYFSALHQVTALGIAFGEKSRLVAIGWSGAALATFALAPALVPSFGAAGASWCVVLMYGGLNLYYVRESQRLHPLPFRARPIAVHVAVGLAAVGGAAAMDTREVSPGNIGLKLAVLAILVGVVLGAGGLNVPRVRTAITNLIALRRTRP